MSRNQGFKTSCYKALLVNSSREFQVTIKAFIRKGDLWTASQLPALPKYGHFDTSHFSVDKLCPTHCDPMDCSTSRLLCLPLFPGVCSDSCLSQ